MKLSTSKFEIALARNSTNIKDLSVSSGVSSNTIYSWIKKRDNREPSTKNLGKVAKALKVDVTELIEYQ